MLAASVEPNLSLPLNRDIKNNDNFFLVKLVDIAVGCRHVIPMKVLI